MKEQEKMRNQLSYETAPHAIRVGTNLRSILNTASIIPRESLSVILSPPRSKDPVLTPPTQAKLALILAIILQVAPALTSLVWQTDQCGKCSTAFGSGASRSSQQYKRHQNCQPRELV